MTEWFNPKNTDTPFGDGYTEEFGLSNERTIQEVNSMEQMIRRGFSIKPRVLDLAGGFGRIGKQLQERGLVSSLVDFDLNFRFLRMAQQAGISNVVNGDMRRLPLKSDSFDLALLMFTSFGYFSTKEGDMQVIHEANRILTAHGQFLMDLPNFHRITQNFSPTRELKLSNGETIRYTKRIEDGVLIEERVIIKPEEEAKILAPMKLRIYLAEDIQTLCINAGFKSIELTDENLNPFNPNVSRRLWVKCQK